MSFLDKIPEHHRTLRDKQTKVESELFELWDKIEQSEAADMAQSHACSCEYCHISEDAHGNILSTSEVAEIESQIDDKNKELDIIKADMVRLESYANFVGAPIFRAVKKGSSHASTTA